MKKLIIVTFICAFIVLFGSNALYGQIGKQISLTAINESIAFPFTSYGEFQPGIELGISIRTTENEHSILQLNTYAGWFLHQHIESGFYLPIITPLIFPITNPAKHILMVLYTRPLSTTVRNLVLSVYL